MEISNLPDKELKVMVIKMFTKLGRRMMNTEFQQRENIRQYQTEVTELKNMITEMKNTLEDEGFNSKEDEAKNRSVI